MALRARPPLAARRRLPPWLGGRPIVGLIVGLAVLWLIETVLLHQVFTAAYPSANDFYPRWVGARALWQEGLNPYAPEVTQRIQVGMFGRPAGPNEDQVAFAYPLYVVFFVGPLAWLPYAWAQAAWQALLLNALVAAVLIGMGAQPRRLARPWLVALVLAAILFYPVARSLILGQFAVIVVLALTVALWAQRTERDGLAGGALALGLVKPHLLFLIAPLWLIWALRRGRWATLGGFAVVSGTLLIGSLLVQPTWPLDFVRGLGEYQAYTRAEYQTQPTLRTLLSWLPAGLAEPAFWALGLVGVIAALVLWWRLSPPAGAVGRLPAAPADSGCFTWRFHQAYAAAATVTLLFPFDQPTTNQLILLPALAPLMARATPRAVAVWLPLALVVPWAVFLLTQEDKVESPLQYLIVLVPAAVIALRPRRGGVGSRQ